MILKNRHHGCRYAGSHFQSTAARPLFMFPVSSKQFVATLQADIFVSAVSSLWLVHCFTERFVRILLDVHVSVLHFQDQYVQFNCLPNDKAPKLDVLFRWKHFRTKLHGHYSIDTHLRSDLS